MFSIQLPRKAQTLAQPVLTVLKPDPKKVYTEEEILLLDRLIPSVEKTDKTPQENFENYRDRMIIPCQNRDKLIYDTKEKRWKIISSN